MTGLGADPAQELLNLARERALESRTRLFENMTDLFLSPENRLTDRERAMMEGILGKLLHDLEMTVRRNLAERLAKEDAPRELVRLLANDSIEVAQPLLRHSRLLHDQDLIEIVRHRSHEHRLAVAARAGLSAAVSDALVQYGDEAVIEVLINNKDAAISQQALAYLVAESRRVDRFQEPLLRRGDLPPVLAHRMFWWVSAGLRQAILTKFQLPLELVDEAIRETTRTVLDASDSEAQTLSRSLARRGRLSEDFVVQNLRRGFVSAALSGLAELCGIDLVTVQRIVFDPGGEALAAACKAACFTRAGYSAIFLLSRESQDQEVTVPTERLQELLRLFDRITSQQAKSVLRFWAREDDYQAAVAALEQNPGNPAEKRTSL